MTYSFSNSPVSAELPEKANVIWVDTYNETFTKTQDVEKSKKQAWEVVKARFSFVGNEWFEKTFENLVRVPLNPFSSPIVTKSEESEVDTVEKALTAAQRDALPDSDFAYVATAADGTKVRKLPIHDAAHVRNALARFSQTQGIPTADKQKVLRKIIARAKKLGIDVGQDMLTEAGL